MYALVIVVYFLVFAPGAVGGMYNIKVFKTALFLIFKNPGKFNLITSQWLHSYSVEVMMLTYNLRVCVCLCRVGCWAVEGLERW